MAGHGNNKENERVISNVLPKSVAANDRGTRILASLSWYVYVRSLYSYSPGLRIVLICSKRDCRAGRCGVEHDTWYVQSHPRRFDSAT